MCPSDDNFPATLRLFSPPPPHEDAWYESVWKCIYGVVDWVLTHMALLVEIATFLSPVLLPFAVGLTAWLYSHAPEVAASILDPVLPDTLRPDRGKPIAAGLGERKEGEKQAGQAQPTALPIESMPRAEERERTEGARSEETRPKHKRDRDGGHGPPCCKLIYMGHGEYQASP